MVGSGEVTRLCLRSMSNASSTGACGLSLLRLRPVEVRHDLLHQGLHILSGLFPSLDHLGMIGLSLAQQQVEILSIQTLDLRSVTSKSGIQHSIVGDKAESDHPDAAMSGNDDLWYCRHTNKICSEAAQHPTFGAGLIAELVSLEGLQIRIDDLRRPAEIAVDAFMQHSTPATEAKFTPGPMRPPPEVEIICV